MQLSACSTASSSSASINSRWFIILFILLCCLLIACMNPANWQHAHTVDDPFHSIIIKTDTVILLLVPQLDPAKQNSICILNFRQVWESCHQAAKFLIWNRFRPPCSEEIRLTTSGFDRWKRKEFYKSAFRTAWRYIDRLTHSKVTVKVCGVVGLYTLPSPKCLCEDVRKP